MRSLLATQSSAYGGAAGAYGELMATEWCGHL